MNINKVIKYFGTQSKAAQALGVTQPTLSNWKQRGGIPGLQQLRIQHLTDGQLKADSSILKISHL